MSKLIVVCGQTATGKTKLAVQLAKAFKGELVAADSRQVYKGMDVGTGKDRPAGVKIWGYDLVNPDEDFSVADWVNWAWSVIKKLEKRHKLPIVVGGTGLYLKSLIEPPTSLGIKPDKQLRQELDRLSVEQLQWRLKRVAPERFEQMNWSDQHNPRRLIRAIEVALRLPFDYAQGGQAGRVAKVGGVKKTDIIWVGLMADKVTLKERIRRRVLARARGGMTQEVRRLMNRYRKWNYPAFSATGYEEWRSYLEGKSRRREAIEAWIQAETDYARRQWTWFKKQKQIHWFDIATQNWQNRVRQKVERWLNGKN